MSRKPLAAVLVLLSAALVLGGNWIGNTYLDDSGRHSPASLNSTGDM